MNLIYYRQQTSSARDPAPIEFNEDFAVNEMLKYIFEDFVNPDKYKPYYTVPESFKKSYIKTEEKQEFLQIIKAAFEKIKKMTFQELDLPSPTPKGEEILRSIKALHPNLDIEEVKGTIRTRLLEEPADIESSISSASGFLSARELNRYLKHLEETDSVDIDIKKTGKDKEQITIRIKELKANLADLKSADGENIDLSGIENIKRLSETKDVKSKLIKIFTLGFTDAKLASKERTTLNVLANVNPPARLTMKTVEGRNVLEKDLEPMYYGYLREKQELMLVQTMLTLLATIKSNEKLYNNVYERFKNSPDALYQLSEESAKVFDDETLKIISDMFYDLSVDAKEYFTTPDEEGEIIIGDVRELLRKLSDSEVIIKPPNIVKPLENAVKAYKEHKKTTNKTETVNKKAMKKLTTLIKELKDMVYNQDTTLFDKFDFTPTLDKKMKVKGKKKRQMKTGKLKGKPTYTLGELIRNPNLLTTEGKNKQIKNINEELDKLDIDLDKL